MVMGRAMILVFVASSLISMVVAIPGTATFYGPTYVPSSCYGFQEQGTMIAAANPTLFNNRAACGTLCRVRCTGGTNLGVPQPCRNGEITVKIVDLCPGCQTDQLDLSQEAFAMIADPNAGRITTEYTCGV